MSSLQPHLSHPKYRPDIDGLRAIAVLAVVAFHAFPSWVKGGFVGVDVFFVISGYLISTIIFENLDKGTFSFAEFYARRIKRIFPALILVLVAVYAFGWFALLADEYKQLGKHIAAGAGFVSNIVLWNEAGYFDSSAETKPLLHLWSLGIEEQFYIVWPLLLWLTWKRKFNLLTITILVAVVSFYLNVKGVKKDAVATFYLPHTRFWELLCGSLLAWVTLYKQGSFATIKSKLDVWITIAVYREKSEADGKVLSNVLSFVGLLLLAYGFLLINKELIFPGKWAIVPVLGAVLIIFAGPKAWGNRNILSNKIAVWFGLISYPLYLWHWPLLSFARIVEGDSPSRNIRITAVVLSVVLAWLTFKLVEQPLRLGKHSKSKVIVLVLLMTVVGYVGYSTYKRDGLDFRLPKFEITQSTIDCDASRINGEVCEFGNRLSSKKIIAYGDSHMLHIARQLVDQLGAEFSIDIVYSGSCFMGNKVRFDKIGNKEQCDRKVRYLESIKDSKPAVIITGQRWHGYGIDTKEEIVEAVTDRIGIFGIKSSKLIILGSTADVPFDCEKSKVRPMNTFKSCQQTEITKSNNKVFMDTTESMVHPSNVFFVYPYRHLCPKDICIVSDDSVSNYMNIHHLSFNGGKDVVREISNIIGR